MIRSFRDRKTEDVFNGGDGDRRWAIFKRVALRKLLMLNAATSLHDLKSPPNNRLETLKSDRKGQHAIRVNDQWRLCFEWKDGHAHNVEIVDYH